MSDVNEILKMMDDFLKQGIDNYTFENTDDIPVVISGLRGARQYQLALDLYKKYETTLQASDMYIVGLSNIIQVCNDCGNTPLLIEYAKQLKVIADDHPFVIELEKKYTL